MFNRGLANFSLTFAAIGGLAAVLFLAGCGSSAKPRLPDAAIEPVPDVAADDQVPDTAPTADAPADAASDARPADVRDGALAADASGEAGAAEDAEVEDSGPDLPPIHGPLLAYWPLDEGSGTATADTSGNGAAASLMNGATWTAPGFPGAQFANPGAVVLDGVDDLVELGARAVPRHEAPKTVSLWFSADAASMTGRRNIISMTDFNGTGWGTQIGLDAGLASVWFTDDPAGMINSPAPVAAGWHHLAYTYDGTVNRFYLDMQILGEITRAPQPAPVEHARLGGFDLPLELFAGRVDDVRIYDHALDAAAIIVLFGGNMP
jgi:hypothetical protein